MSVLVKLTCARFNVKLKVHLDIRSENGVGSFQLQNCSVPVASQIIKMNPKFCKLLKTSVALSYMNFKPRNEFMEKLWCDLFIWH